MWLCHVRKAEKERNIICRPKWRDERTDSLQSAAGDVWGVLTLDLVHAGVRFAWPKFTRNHAALRGSVTSQSTNSRRGRRL
jgi:hypothetical protein